MSLLSERIIAIAMAADFSTSRLYFTNVQKFRLRKISFDDSIVHMQSHNYKKCSLSLNFLVKLIEKNNHEKLLGQ